MTWRVATQPVGSALRIAPGFVATTTDDALGVQTSVTTHYEQAEGRYVIKSVTNTATRDDVELNYPTVAKVGMQAIVQAAAPRCIFVTLDDENDPKAKWLSVDQLTTAAGRILPPLVAAEVVKRGGGDARMEAVELLYGSAALAGLPPAKLLQQELGIPHRTASQWIIDARKAGRLEGMNYNAGRPAGG
ncbi:hypothetical protein KZX43_04730 [Microbacterium sp. EYE_512]|uniref:Uncharacterized protein n=1 Tax=Microbacterium wangchenii TaxID=2541726 RepID=A0ABX5T139_9MICO|nr:hypothetical protein [Microbacterium sp. EYE_512]QBR90789.1 hypothetical protein E4K62_16240 [Microbacterium wangchenii]